MSHVCLTTVLYILYLSMLTSGEVPHTNYRFEIDTKPEGLRQGYLLPWSREGALVRINPRENDFGKEDGIEYLRLKVTKGDTLGRNVTFLVINTDAFRVDEDHFLVVNNSKPIESFSEIIFNVVLVSVPEQDIISNALPLAIHVDKSVEDESEEDYSPSAAIFAGVLVLLIVFLALFIPLVIRAKRRVRQGKPAFKLGSHPSSADLGNDINRIESKEPNWYNNTAFNYEDEVKKEKTGFTDDIIAMTRCVSDETLQLNKPNSGNQTKTGSTNMGILKKEESLATNTTTTVIKEESKL